MRCAAALALWLQLASWALALQLSHYVRRHWPLIYAPLPEAAGRERRSAAAGLRLTLATPAGRLSLLLTADDSVLTPTATVAGPTGRRRWADTPLAYRGRVLGRPGSLVLGTVVEGVFAGTIRLSDDTLFVERAAPHVEGGPEPHSFVYRQRDMVLAGPPDGYRACGVADAQPSADRSDAPPDHAEPHARNASLLSERGGRRSERDSEGVLGPQQTVWPSDTCDQAQHPFKARRSVKEETRVCTMYLETGPTMWDFALQRYGGSVRRSALYLQALVVEHMQAANQVYAGVAFDVGMRHRVKMQFQLEHLQLTDDSTCLVSYKGTRSRLCLSSADSDTLLDAHSQVNFNAFCLAFLFTYRDFKHGRIGLAWIGSPQEGGVGVCSRYQSRNMFNENTGIGHSIIASFNTGFVSFLNFGKFVHPLSTQLTLAHEIGHALGSPHDTGDVGSPCLPFGDNGNYIMYYLAQSGVQPNNARFSACSRANISHLLTRLTGKRDCFVAPAAPFCGNGRVEKGEQCDCGVTDAVCTDPCCFPRVPSERRFRDRGCTLKPGAACSPTAGGCCDAVTCRPVTAGANVTCDDGGDCAHPAICDGKSADCPKPAPRPDHTPCRGGARVCLAGGCTGSLCLVHHQLPCQLRAADVANSSGSRAEERRQLCRLGCRRSAGAPCRPQPGPSLPPGAACAGDRGVCDVHGRCRPMRPAGAADRLRELLTGESPFAAGRLPWWAVLLLVLLLVVVCALFLRCIALHIPSSNPHKPPPRPAMDTLRTPVSTFLGLRGGGELEI